MNRRLWLLAVLSAGIGCALPGCQQQGHFNTTNVTGAEYGPSLRLHDHNGRIRTLADFKGKVVVVFFGYTSCPDVCPTTMTMMMQVMQKMGEEDASRVQVLFVTVDPARDTPERLKEYVTAFNPHFLGLIGTDAEVASVAKDFHVVYEKHGDIAGGHYSIDHTAGCFVFDPQGRARLFVRHGETAERVAADLKSLLSGA